MPASWVYSHASQEYSLKQTRGRFYGQLKAKKEIFCE